MSKMPHILVPFHVARGCFVWLVLSTSLSAAWAGDQTPCELLEDKIIASDGDVSSQFGYALDIEGGRIAVSAWQADLQGPDSGQVYIYQLDRGQWVEQSTLLPSDGGDYDQFGSFVALDGPALLVGASEHDGAGFNAGAAYVYRLQNSQWVQEDLLFSDSPDSNDRFGISGAIAGDVLMVGAPQDDTIAGNAGAVYVFNRIGDTWIYQQTLLASDGAGFDHFGNSISLSADMAIIGAHLHNNPTGPRSGSVYVFRRSGSTWTEVDQIYPTDGVDFDFFGFSTALDGNRLAVGAYRNDLVYTDAGAAYLYRYNGSTWVPDGAVTASDALPSDYFGSTVGLSGDTLLVGAYNNGIPGAAYWFDRLSGSWLESRKLIPSDPGINDRFGAAVDLSDNIAVVGSHQDDDNGLSSGSAYVYSLDCPAACSGDDCCSSVADCADLDGDGVRDDSCTWWRCFGTCTSIPVAFGDVGGFNGQCAPDGATDANDRFHALNCFSNQDTLGLGGSYPCEALPPTALNVDAGGAFGHCAPDGVCDANDAFHAINTFNGQSTCTCNRP